jgi:hypothetical protein
VLSNAILPFEKQSPKRYVPKTSNWLNTTGSLKLFGAHTKHAKCGIVNLLKRTNVMANGKGSNNEHRWAFAVSDSSGRTGPSDPNRLAESYDINYFGPDSEHDRAAGRGDEAALALNRKLAAEYARFHAELAALGDLAVT